LTRAPAGRAPGPQRHQLRAFGPEHRRRSTSSATSTGDSETVAPNSGGEVVSTQHRQSEGHVGIARRPRCPRSRRRDCLRAPSGTAVAASRQVSDVVKAGCRRRRRAYWVDALDVAAVEDCSRRPCVVIVVWGPDGLLIAALVGTCCPRHQVAASASANRGYPPDHDEALNALHWGTVSVKHADSAVPVLLQSCTLVCCSRGTNPSALAMPARKATEHRRSTGPRRPMAMLARKQHSSAEHPALQLQRDENETADPNASREVWNRRPPPKPHKPAARPQVPSRSAAARSMRRGGKTTKSGCFHLKSRPFVLDPTTVKDQRGGR